jgi:hypothetical protein
VIRREQHGQSAPTVCGAVAAQQCKHCDSHARVRHGKKMKITPTFESQDLLIIHLWMISFESKKCDAEEYVATAE